MCTFMKISLRKQYTHGMVLDMQNIVNHLRVYLKLPPYAYLFTPETITCGLLVMTAGVATRNVDLTNKMFWSDGQLHSVDGVSCVQ